MAGKKDKKIIAQDKSDTVDLPSELLTAPFKPKLMPWEIIKRTGAITTTLLTLAGVLYLFFDANSKLKSLDAQITQTSEELQREIMLRKHHYSEIYLKSKIPNRSDSIVYSEDPDTLYWVSKKVK